MSKGERVVAALHEIFPQAPILTTMVGWDLLRPELAEADIRPSWMPRLPGWKKYFEKYLPFYPPAIESLEVKKYDLLIRSSGASAKSAKMGPNALPICYCYTPMRFAGDYQNSVKRENLNLWYRSSPPLMIAGLRK